MDVAGELQPTVSQPHVRALGGATLSETNPLMVALRSAATLSSRLASLENLPRQAIMPRLAPDTTPNGQKQKTDRNPGRVGVFGPRALTMVLNPIHRVRFDPWTAFWIDWSRGGSGGVSPMETDFRLAGERVATVNGN